jgi:peptidoglycan/LPS O-acetylase OafA/YrhL
MNPHSLLTYRPDIDGLRAIAVLAVIGFHASPNHFPGGFLGVDIFFVISGYLITRLIYQQLEERTFTLLVFYTRRMRRLLPSYILVSFCTLVSSAYLLIPNDFVFFTTSLAASWAFVANIFFSMLSWGYFGQRSEGFPLLHSWSLSVEEQFYFIFPLLLIFLFRYFKKYLFLISLLAAIGFVFISESGTNRVGSYFLLPYRAHELLIGSLGFFLARERLVRSIQIASLMGALGISLILGALFFMQREMPLPGVLSLVPCLGTALLIYSGVSPTSIRAVLSWRPLVLIGLLSYSLYLWHWPIFSFLNYRKITMSWSVISAATGLTFVLAYLSWRYVEQPIRQHQQNFRQAFAKFYLLPASLFLIIGITSYVTEGIPQRFSPDLRQLISSYSYERDLTRTCAIRAEDQLSIDYDHLASHCAFGDLAQNNIDVLLYGDSHAQHFKPFLDNLTRRAQLKSVYHVEGGCDSVDLNIDSSTPASRCQQRNQSLLAMAGRFKYVVLASSWSYKGKEELFKQKMVLAVQTIIKAHAIPIIFKDNPSTEEDLSQCILFQKRGWASADTQCYLEVSAVRERHASVDQMIDTIQSLYPSVVVVDPKRVMCDASVCLTYSGNTAFYKDANHLNSKASVLLADLYLEVATNPFQLGKYRWIALQAYAKQ